MMNRKSWKTAVVMWTAFLCGLLWLAVKIAMSCGQEIDYEQFRQNFAENARNVFVFSASDRTGAFVMAAVVIWLVLLSGYLFRAGQYMHGKEHGSAGFADVRELNRKYAQQQSIILSQNLSVGLDMYRHQHNLNILVIGGSGSGKSRGFCFPGLLSGNCNYVVTDPKAEALRSTGYALERMGYEVRVLNLIDMRNSFRYNPFRYLRKDSDVIALIMNFVQNTTPKDARGGDPFWTKAEIALLQALMFYLWYEAPEYEQNFAMMAEMLRYAEVREKDEDHRSPLDMLFDELKAKKPEHIACRQYDMYRLAAGKTAKSILVMAGVSLSLFGIQEVVDLTSEDELHFSDLADRKIALFCVTSDCDPSFDWLASMLYTQLFQELEYAADKRPDGRLKRHVRVILDEYANISISSGQTNDGGQKVLSTCRSRNFSLNIIIQNIAQLKGLFKDTWENVTGCCDVMVYLGGNEQGTHKYIADEMSKTTIRYDTYSKSASSLNTNINVTGRELMTPGEVRELDRRNCIVFIANEKPAVDRKYDLMKHPNISLSQQGGAPPYYYRRKRT